MLNETSESVLPVVHVLAGRSDAFAIETVISASKHVAAVHTEELALEYATRLGRTDNVIVRNQFEQALKEVLPRVHAHMCESGNAHTQTEDFACQFYGAFNVFSATARESVERVLANFRTVFDREADEMEFEGRPPAFLHLHVRYLEDKLG